MKGHPLAVGFALLFVGVLTSLVCRGAAEAPPVPQPFAKATP